MNYQERLQAIREDFTTEDINYYVSEAKNATNEDLQEFMDDLATEDDKTGYFAMSLMSDDQKKVFWALYEQFEYNNWQFGIMFDIIMTEINKSQSVITGKVEDLRIAAA